MRKFTLNARLYYFILIYTLNLSLASGLAGDEDFSISDFSVFFSKTWQQLMDSHLDLFIPTHSGRVPGLPILVSNRTYSPPVF